MASHRWRFLIENNYMHKRICVHRMNKIYFKWARRHKCCRHLLQKGIHCEHEYVASVLCAWKALSAFVGSTSADLVAGQKGLKEHVDPSLLVIKAASVDRFTERHGGTNDGRIYLLHILVLEFVWVQFPSFDIFGGGVAEPRRWPGEQMRPGTSIRSTSILLQGSRQNGKLKLAGW